MSNTHDTHGSHDGHGHGGHGGADHVPHVTPLNHYFAVFGALLILTVLTVAASYVDFGSMNLVIAMIIATTKACLVALIFMHLLYDHRFHALVFSFSLIFLGIFITFTSFDVFGRGKAEDIEGRRPAVVTDPFKKDALPKPMDQVRVPHYGKLLEEQEEAETGKVQGAEHAPAPAPEEKH